MLELAEAKEIKFPLKEAEYLKALKTGKVSYRVIEDELYELMQRAIKAMDESDLPNEVDVEYWDKWLLTIYKKEL